MGYNIQSFLVDLLRWDAHRWHHLRRKLKRIDENFEAEADRCFCCSAQCRWRHRKPVQTVFNGRSTGGRAVPILANYSENTNVCIKKWAKQSFGNFWILSVQRQNFDLDQLKIKSRLFKIFQKKLTRHWVEKQARA